MHTPRISPILISLVSLIMLGGYFGTSSQLKSLKSNYNEGKYKYVLAEESGEDYYAANDVITEALNDDDKITADQAKLIRARALMNRLLNDRLYGKDKKEADMREAIKLVNEIDNSSLPNGWMKVESDAMIADTHYAMSNYTSAFEAYDYTLRNNDFKNLNLQLEGYITRWANSYEHAVEESYKQEVKQQFQTTLIFLTKQYPDNVSLIYAEIIQLIVDGKAAEAMQCALLARSYEITQPGKQVKIDQQMGDLIYSDVLPEHLKCDYVRFVKLWSNSTYEWGKYVELCQ